MTLAMVGLFYDLLNQFVFLIFAAGLFATLFESFVGALFQQRLSLLTNEIVNGIQTGFAALVAMLLAAQLL